MRGTVRATISEGAREIVREARRLESGTNRLSSSSGLTTLNLANFRQLTGLSAFTSDTVSGNRPPLLQFFAPKKRSYEPEPDVLYFPQALAPIARGAGLLLSASGFGGGSGFPFMGGRRPTRYHRPGISAKAMNPPPDVGLSGEVGAYKGFAPEIRNIANFALAMWPYILRDTSIVHDSFGRDFGDLLKVRRFALKFTAADGSWLTARDPSVEEDVLSIELAIGRAGKDEILSKLTPEALLYLIFQSRRHPKRFARLDENSMSFTDAFEGESKGLYREVASAVRAFATDENNTLAVLKQAFYKGLVPEGFEEVLRKIGYAKADIKSVLQQISIGRPLIDIRVRPDPRKSEPGRLYVANYHDRASHGGVGIGCIVAEGRYEDITGLTQPDIYSLFARLILLANFFTANMLRLRWDVRVQDLGRPLAAYGSVRIAQGSRKSEIVRTGDWNEEWVEKMRLFLSFITQYIAKDELDTSRLLLMNDLFSYVLVRDGSAADRLSAHFLVEGQGAGERRSLMVNVPDNYVGATVENLILALKRTTFYSFDGGKRSKTIVRQEVPDHVWSRLAGRTTFAEMILKGEIPAEGLAIKGGAARTIGRSLAGSFNRLWRLARSGHAPDKAKVLNDWLGSQRAWIVQHVEKDSAHQIIIERKDDGLLIVVRGEEPSPAAWDQVLLASSMANNGTLVLFLDEFGGFRKTDDVGLSGRTRALFCELRGVNGSLTFGAENNPRWTEEKDPDKKDRYVDALRWFAENGRGLQASLIPSPDDIKATVDRKYRTFAKLYHPDKDPKNRELFKEAADHYNIVRGLAP